MNVKDENNNNMEPSGEFADGLRDFRAAVTHIAERETARPIAVDWLAPARRRRRGHQHRMILAWGCAALLCCATLPFAIPSGPTAPSHAAVQPVEMPGHSFAPPSSSTLLEQVDDQVSESVPSSLAPLVDLDSMNTASASPSDASLDGTALALTERTNAAH